ncbi:hypothetical protein DNTS_016669 [Danionella cerebrum]|uniref:non-specific serine/threonine protein kinase n=1 Tax=Danionella cerebrum TaxID=2873325 RepID=A0A553RFQ4_9TELE|nr:hypothetical protein DNTS_016669 [Danionella translucida]
MKKDISFKEVHADQETSHQNSEASVIDESSAQEDDPPEVQKMPADDGLVSAPSGFSDSSEVISDSGVISEIYFAERSSAYDEPGTESTESSTDDDTSDAELPTAADKEINVCFIYFTDSIFSRYAVGAMLGKGGFGSVYKGMRLQDGLKVAVKIVQKTRNTERVPVDFHPKAVPKEIALMSMATRVPCSNIVQLLDWADYKGVYIMVMERPLPCLDLDKLLNLRGGVLSESDTQIIVQQALNAITICCRRGIFHRDLKLENLLVDPRTLETKLIDFGCGDFMKDSSYSSFAGTTAYYPPEYFDTEKYNAKPATVYSIGVLMFTILHGRFLTAEDKYNIENDWSAFDVSAECCHLMWACLRRSPQHRILLEQIHSHDWFHLDLSHSTKEETEDCEDHSESQDLLSAVIDTSESSTPEDDPPEVQKMPADDGLVSAPSGFSDSSEVISDSGVIPEIYSAKRSSADDESGTESTESSTDDDASDAELPTAEDKDSIFSSYAGFALISPTTPERILT